MSVHDEVNQAIRGVLHDLNGDASIAVSPTLLAMKTIDLYSEEEDYRIRWGAIEHFKALARKILARKYDLDADESESYQGDMFSGELQERYPIPRKSGEEPVYKSRNLLTRAEVDWNIEMLRKSADARLRHADALVVFRDTMLRDIA